MNTPSVPIHESRASSDGYCDCGWEETNIRFARSRHGYQHRQWKDGIPVSNRNWDSIEKQFPRWGEIVLITRQAWEPGVRHLPYRLSAIAQREGGWDIAMFPFAGSRLDKRYPAAYVLIRDRRAIAYAIVNEDWDTSVLSDIWIAGAHRGQGIGRTLVEIVAKSELGSHSAAQDLIFMPPMTKAGYAFFKAVGGRLPPYNEGQP
jgi:ribosomal protein S18 acetylase RimI-like enzyme